MKRRSPIQLSTLSCLLTFLLVPLQGLLAQQDKVTAFKQSLGIKQKRLSHTAAGVPPRRHRSTTAVVYTTNRLSRVTTLFTRLCRPLEGFPRSEL